MILQGLGAGGNLIVRGLGLLWRALVEELTGTLRALDAVAGRMVEVDTILGRLLG